MANQYPNIMLKRRIIFIRYCAVKNIDMIEACDIMSGKITILLNAVFNYFER